MQTLIRGALVVTMNAGNEILPRGDVVIDGGRIIHVGPSPEGPPPGHLDQVIDGTGLIAIPGLVNAHSHGISHLNRGRLHGRPLEIWRQYLLSSYRQITADEVYLAGLLSSIEMLKTGTTTVVDHFYAFIAAENQGARHLLRAWQEAGIRGVMTPYITDVGYERTVPLRVDAGNAGAMAELKRISASENRETLAAVAAMMRREAGRHPRIHFQIGPGAPQRCTDDMLRQAQRIAREFDTRLHIHVAESRTQFHHVRRTFGTTPIGLLDKLGLLDDRLTMAHCIWLTDADIERVAATGASVVHCPSSNMKLGDGIAAIPEMLAAGVNVALGADGSGSNDAQNVWLELRGAAMIHNCRFVDFDRWVSAEAALRMATINGARSCGLDGLTGTLEPGKRADIALLSRYTPSFMPLNDVQAQLVFCECGASVDTVLVEGQVVVAGGRMVTVDERAVYQRLEAAMAVRREAMEREIAGVRPLVPALREMYFRENAGFSGWLSGPVRDTDGGRGR